MDIDMDTDVNKDVDKDVVAEFKKNPSLNLNIDY